MYARKPIFHYAYRLRTIQADGRVGFSVTAYAGGALAFGTFHRDGSAVYTWLHLATDFRVQLSRLLDEADAWLPQLPLFFPCNGAGSSSLLHLWKCAPIILEDMAVQFQQPHLAIHPGVASLGALFGQIIACLGEQGFYLGPGSFHWDGRCQVIETSANQTDALFFQQIS